jgi:opacity protein-like surface antigen
MKKTRVFLLAMAIGLAAGSVAIAAPYVSFNMGAVWVNDSEYSDSGTYYDGFSYMDEGEFTFDTGFGVTAAFGNAFDHGLRVEVEFGYRINDIDEAEGTYSEFNPYGNKVYEKDYFGSLSGEVMTSSLMLNIFYEFLPRSLVSPFVGAGIGIANVIGDIDYYDDENDTVFAYQLAAGVAFALNQNLKLDLQYRFFATEDPDFRGLETEYLTHNLMAGLRFTF